LAVGTPGRYVGMRPSMNRIQLKHSRGEEVLSDLNQLKGWIEVRDAQTALRVVRLRTLGNAYFLWPQEVSELEIVQEGTQHTLPDYGWTKVSVWRWERGAVLSPSEYRQQDYTPPSVEKVSDGYRITRWLLTCQLQPDATRLLRVQKIQEWIGEDGGYERKVLSTRIAEPSLRKRSHRLFPLRE
jgi:hypothetical protein